MSKQVKLTFERFLKNNKILVVDSCGVSRSRLKSSLVKMGAVSDAVYTTSDFEKALEYAKTNKPTLVLSDYIIRNGSGFDLFKTYKATYPEFKDIITILITSSIDQSTVAKAAEEDVDSFLIKPYTAKSLLKGLSETVNRKLNPSPYIATIEEGKDLLFAKQYEEASQIFMKAKTMAQNPSLAFYYQGQAEYLLKLTNQAEDNYKGGLNVSKIHFKCQVGLYEVLKEQGRLEEAYEVVRNIAKYFPANPERLGEVVRLCITTKNYHHMLEYHNTYLELSERGELLKRYLAAGLYVAGKYQLLEGNFESAYIYFEKIAISFFENSKVLREIILLLIQENRYKEAERILARYPLGQDDSHYEVLEYLVRSPKYQAFEKIKKGEILLSKEIYDIRVVKLMLGAFQEKGDSHGFNQIYQMAVSRWPELEDCSDFAA